MTKRIKIFAMILAGALCIAGPARAYDLDRHVGPKGMLHLYVGTNMSQVEYNEPDIGVSHNITYFPGLVAKISIENPNEFMFFTQASYKYLSGKYDYNGYVQDMAGRRRDYNESALPVSKHDFEAVVGTFAGSFRLFAGVQYELYNDDGYQVNDYFYKRTRSSYYGVIGAGVRKEWEDYRSLELVVKAKPLLQSYHDSRLSDLGGMFADVPTLHQKQESGFRFDVSVIYQYEMLWVEPYFSYTGISETEKTAFCMGGGLCGTAQEPANKTIEFGVNIGIRF